MFTLLASAWRIVVNRSLADWLILSAALVTVLIATTLLAAGPIYADAVALSGVHRTLEDAPVQDVNVEVSIRTDGERFAAADRNVQSTVAAYFSQTGGTIYRRGTSESYALPIQDNPDVVRNLALFGFFERFEENVTLVSGDWPSDSNEPYETVVSQATADLLGVDVEDELTMTNRRDENYQPAVMITGIFEINDPTDPYWFEDSLDVEGVIVSDSFTTYGRFVVTRDVFFDALTPQSGETEWRVLPAFPNLAVDEIEGLRRNVENLNPQLNLNASANNQYSVTTELDSILREAERSLLVTRSGVLVLTIQLAILAGYALLLTAGLLVDQRGVETALIRSRGANNRQIATMAMMEGLLIALPAVLLGPPLAALSLRMLNRFGPLAEIELTIAPQISSTAYLLALLTGLACVAALTLPALISARSFSRARAERGRQGSQAFSQRAGIDLVLLLLAGIAYWQLRRYSAPITQTVEGRLGIDPLLVSAPAIGLLAGAVIALRTIPLLARLSEKIAIAGSRIVPALGAWQMARRPMRYARSALLLILAISIGLFAVSYSETWKLSQDDQADYQIGADIRVTPNQRVGRSIPRQNLPDGYSQLDGVTQSLPVARQTGQLSRSAGSAQVILLNASSAAGVVQFRPDLSDERFNDLMFRLEAGRPVIATLPLPGEPQQIALDLRFEVDPLSPDQELPFDLDPDDRLLQLRPSFAVVLQDANGMLFRVDIGNVESSAETRRIVAPLSYPLTNGAVARPAYPLELVDIELRTIAPVQIERTATLEIQSVQTTDGLGSNDWTAVELPGDRDAWEVNGEGIARLEISPSIELAGATEENGLVLAIRSGSSGGNRVVPVTYYLRPAGTELPGTIPVLVSETFLESTASTLGDTTEMQIGDLRGNVTIAGVIRGFPTIATGSAGIIVADLATIAMHRFEPGRTIVGPDELWLEVDATAIEPVSEALSQDPFASRRVDSRSERAQSLLSDPVALGNIGSLSLGFVAAAIFAGIGFIVSAVVSARERITEFALLRALGLSPRQLACWMSLEHGVLLLISLIGGTLLGLALAWLVLPLIAVTQQATQVVPGVIVVVPWLTIVLLELGIALVLFAVVAVLALVLRRGGLGSLLRLGEDS
ncbi:ABC transporter permease [soil metagenome]